MDTDQVYADNLALLRYWVAQRIRLHDTGTCDDILIRTHRFCNHDRELDTGTVMLKEAYEGDVRMPVEYRFLGSNRAYFAGSRKISSRAYQTPPPTRTHSPYDAYTIASDAVANSDILEFIKGKSPMEIADRLLEVTSAAMPPNHKGNRMHYVFHCNEVSKDLAMLYKDQVDYDGPTYFGPGASFGFKCLFRNDLPAGLNIGGKQAVKWTRKHLDELASVVSDIGHNWMVTEHILCEFGKYRRLMDTGKGCRKYKPSKPV